MSNVRRLGDLALSDTGFAFDPLTGATFTVNATGLCVLLAMKEGLAARRRRGAAARALRRRRRGRGARRRRFRRAPPPARDRGRSLNRRGEITMSNKPLTIAVTGLNATDNPAPGVGVLRALRESGPEDRLVGLAYDALDPGVYAPEIAPEVFMIPYPSQGVAAFLSRIAYVHDKVGLDVIVPTLDAELPSFIALEPTLREMGIGLLLPTREQLELRSKVNLAALGRAGRDPRARGRR